MKHQMIGEKIEELIFHVDDRPDLLKAMRDAGLNFEQSAIQCPWAYAAFIKPLRFRKILFSFSSTHQMHPVCSLAEYLHACGKLGSIQKATLALDCFYQSGIVHGNDEALATLPSIMRGRPGIWGQNSIVDEILSESNGLLIWHDQLERLLSCTGISQVDDRSDLRKKLNAKYPEAWERIKSLFFLDGSSLEQVLNERMLDSHCTSAGNWTGGMALKTLLDLRV